MNNELIYTVSDFVGIFNQTLEYAYPSVSIVGELSNFKVSKGKWIYFDLKDDYASLRFFGTVYALPGPLEEGMMVQVSGMPRLHQTFGFSVNVRAIRPVGEGSLKKAATLLQAKLEKEGLFDPARKRQLPYPPRRIALISSKESAAYADFVKVLGQRWRGLEIELCDVQVQGEAAVPQIVEAIATCNTLAEPPDVLVITRGGGSADDLAVFNTEQVTRAVAASRIPTLVAIGHEVDFSLAELAADQRASTPSNAAELLTPDRTHELKQLQTAQTSLGHGLATTLATQQAWLKDCVTNLQLALRHAIQHEKQRLHTQRSLLRALSPEAALQRGYAIIRTPQAVIQRVSQLKIGQTVEAKLQDGKLVAEILDTEVQ
jgi:exodeoxyribonuclease VII large subunit